MGELGNPLGGDVFGDRTEMMQAGVPMTTFWCTGLVAFLPEQILRFLVNPSAGVGDDWLVIGEKWAWSLIAIAVLGCLFATGLKVFLKRFVALSPEQRTWSTSINLGFIAMCGLGLALATLLLWWLSAEFSLFVTVGGLLIGLLIELLLFFFPMALIHLIGPWKRRF